MTPEKTRLTLDELHDQSEKDLEIRKDQLVLESIRTPSLFSKYNKMLSLEKLALKKAEFELRKKQKECWEYYSGKADPEVYKQKPFGYKILKGNIDKYLDSDPDLEKIKAKYSLQEERVAAVERIMKQISDRQWIIRNVNDTLKFENGV